MNSLVELLNNAGYKNSNTNRERAVRNINLLLDSGVLQLEFISADVYNSKENGRAYWATCKDGKKRPTAYAVVLYGKKYFGHIMEKSEIKKYVKTEYFDGRKEWDTYTTNFDNSKIDVNEMQIRIAVLISTIRNGESFITPRLFAEKGDCSCYKCNGRGIIQEFMHYANGICFDCGGTGIDRETLKMYIAENIKL